MSFQSRDIRHFIEAGVTVAVDVKDGTARVTTAFLSRYEPNYSRPAARTYIGLQFDADDSTIKSLGLKRNVHSFPYTGEMPRRDILYRINDALEPELLKRVKSHRRRGVSKMNQIIREVASQLAAPYNPQSVERRALN